ncbi:SDR family NAD(P)-dependent oxidoreductase [Saccharopolyspora indica]
MIEVDRPLRDLGVSSREAAAVAGELAELLGRQVPVTIVYQHPSVAELVTAVLEPGTSGGPRRAPAPREPIAVLGIGCRLPGEIDSPEQFWDLLATGRDAVGPRPAGRAGPDEPAGYLDDVAGFDADFFGITPREAAVMDPQQRILLEVAWSALEHAGIAPGSLRGSRTGVFAGVSSAEYGALAMADPDQVDAWSGTGAAVSVLANRLSYLLDLRGPSVVVDTACSSSLVAVHQALVSLQRGECDLALVGGVNLLLTPGPFAMFRRAGLLAADARCKAFDAAANGIARGEGCGVLVLRRLSDARSAGDRVLAVLRGSATNSDGRSNGLMAPNPAAQADLLRVAYADADVDPCTVDYVEAHGTGTLLGDPVEAGALGAELGVGRPEGEPLLLGSVKTNLGHLEGAAGITGLIKTVLALGHDTIPASLHFREPNPHIDFAAGRLQVVGEPRSWPRYSGLARAGVSAFGFGGTNAHVVVEEWPTGPAPGDEHDDTTELFAISGRSAERLAARADDLADWLETAPDTPLPDVAAALAVRCDHEPVRAVVQARQRSELVSGLRAVAAGERAPHVVTGTARSDAAAPVFVFSGYGSYWPGMGAHLLAAEPDFAEAVAELEPHFAVGPGFSLSAVLRSSEELTDLKVVQPALFGMQVALARCWQARGVTPAAVIGHSMGEIAAAVVAGALDVPQGLLVMRERARVLAGIDARDPGAMAVVEMSPEELAGLAPRYPGVEIAVHGSPTQCTVSGPPGPVADLVAFAAGRGRFTRVLPLGAAGHSAAVEPGLAGFRAAIGSLLPAPPSVRVFSSVFDPLTEPKFGPDYWVGNLRRPVRFTQAVTAALEQGHGVFLEIAPHPVAVAAVEQTAHAAGADALVLASMRRQAEGFLPALAALHTAGHPAVLRGQYPAAPAVDLPRRRWRHTRHWITSAAPRDDRRHPLLGDHVEVPEDGRHLWQSEVSTAALPWLADHALDGTPVFPATGYLELALAAGGGKAVRDLTLDALLDLSTAATLTTSLTGDQVTVLVRDGDEWVTHASATLTPDDAPAPAPLGRIAGPEIDVHERFTAAGHAYGPAFRGVSTAFAAGGAASAVLTLPEQARPHPAYVLHPALADACLHVLAAAAASATPGRYVPTRIGSVRVLGDPARGTWCAAEIAESTSDSVTGTVQLLADDDTVLVEFAGVHASRLRTATTVLERRWVPAPLPELSSREPRTWAVVSDSPDLAAAFDGDIVRCDLDGSADGVLLLADDATDPEEAQHLVMRVVNLASELAVRASPPRLWLVSSGAHAVAAGETGEPGVACLRALVRVLAFEHPELRATVVDLDPAGSIADLVAEVRADQPDDEVAWRDGQRYSARLARVLLAGGEVPVGEGAYLITGGLGELGLLVASWLVDRGATRLVLSGRTAPSEPAVGVLAELRARGVEVDVVLGDLVDPGVAEQLVEHAQRGGVPLRGVVHGAGVLADRTVAELSADELTRAWRPKVIGGWRLHEATAGVPLDWWLAQSSLAGLVGSPGQAAYATANAWLDALVASRRAAGLPATTINWAAWTRAEGTEDRINAELASVEPAAALDALGAVLADGRSSAGVVQGGLGRAAEIFPELATRPFLADLVARPVRVEERSRPTTLAAVRTRLLALVAELLGTPPEQVDAHAPLTALGLDSLMAMRLRTAVQRDFGAQPPTALLLRGASTTEAAAALAAELGIETGAPAPAVIGPRDPAERWIALVWQEVLGVDEFGVHQEFAELGGTSEHADRVRAAVAERLGEVPADLFATPTVEAMADVVRVGLESSPEGAVRTLRAGTGRPLHLFHPAGGPTSVYQPLVAYLGRPCLGYERVDHLRTVEAKAAHYADLVLDHQPAGPYALGGWSFGGCLAYEVAQVLTARGEQVELVFLIDTILPLPAADEPDAAALRRFGRFAEHIERTYGVTLELSLDELAAVGEDERIGIVLDRVRATVPGIGAAVLHHQYTSYVDARVAERYRPRAWDGPVLLLRAEQPHLLTGSLDPRYLRTDDALGWDELCPDVRVVRVPGDHVSMIDPPHVEVLAARLDAALRTIPSQHRRNVR